MSTSSSFAVSLPTTLKPGFAGKLALAAALVVGADWLFFGHRLGISVVLFAAALGLSAALANPLRASRAQLSAALGVLIAALLPAVEDLNLLSLLFAAIGLAFFALTATGYLSGHWRRDLWNTARLLLAGPFRFVPDVVRAGGLWLREGRASSAVAQLGMWIIPVTFAAVFVALFAVANPVIEGWLAAIDLRRSAPSLDPIRTLFWLFMLAIVWPFVHVRLKAKGEGAPGAALPASAPLSDPDVFFGPGAIMRSLLLFNLIFAVQTVMDAVYLWGGAALPAGTSYASYAHRGAYPLMVTALLAAAFVLAAMRPGGPAEGSRLLRRLVYLWVGQNVLLVLSSILRLELYVAVYSLTYWRVAAFIWMALVASGLVLIVARIALRRSNEWLVSANALVLGLTLYVCCFVNFPALIAAYNVDHREEAMSKGAYLDVSYLKSLGPQAIPAMDTFLAKTSAWDDAVLPQRNLLAVTHLKEMRDWRAWGFRDWRLQRYLGGRATLARPIAGREQG